MTPKVPDYGHQRADTELDILIKKIHKSYIEAQLSLRRKLDKYLRSFEKEDAHKRALYDSGELSHEEFMKWRRKEIFETKQWRDMLEQLAVDLANQNKLAASMINDTLPGVYAINHNYGTYEAEHGSGVDTTYTLYDKNTVARLLKEENDLLPQPSVDIPKDKLWNRQHIQSAVLQGILTGESMSDIAKRFQNVVGMDERAAMRNARTAVTGAENAGRIDSYLRAQAMGIKMKQVWMATLDDRVRDSHAILDGEKQDPGEKFSNGCRYPGDPEGAPSEIYNCFIGDTKIVTDSEIIRSYKHEYSGEIITVKTARGVEFSCTKNHPILTPNGWVRADFLHERDSILVTFVGDGHLSGTNPNVNHVFPRIDTIHKFFNKIGSKRTRNLGVNFHGDIPTTNVEIITSKRFLRNNRDISKTQNVNEILFKCSNSFTFGNSHFMKRFRGIGITSLGFISKSGERISFFWRRMCHTIVHGFRTITRSNTVVPQPEINNMSCDAKFLGNRLDGSSAVVLTDYIVNINISTVSHVPVYNLQTENGYYFVNSIISQKCNGVMAIAHNCRCTLVAEVEGSDPYDPSARPSELLQSMSYDEWKRMHGEQFFTKLFKDYKEPSYNSVATHSVVNGKDISQTWQRRPDQFDFAIDDVINAQGFDGLPRVVSQTEFDEAVRKANNGNGFIAQRAYSAPDKETLDLYREELYKGKWYVDCSVGGASFGQGMYAIPSYDGKVTDEMKSGMDQYMTRWGERPALIETMTLDESASIISLSEIKNMKQQLNITAMKEINDSGWDRAVARKWDAIIHNDDGVFATMLGYDAIKVDTKDLDSYPEIIILNRTKVIFLGK